MGVAATSTRASLRSIETATRLHGARAQRRAAVFVSPRSRGAPPRTRSPEWESVLALYITHLYRSSPSLSFSTSLSISLSLYLLIYLSLSLFVHVGVHARDERCVASCIECASLSLALLSGFSPGSFASFLRAVFFLGGWLCMPMFGWLGRGATNEIARLVGHTAVCGGVSPRGN